jgi:hypothetical protein
MSFVNSNLTVCDFKSYNLTTLPNATMCFVTPADFAACTSITALYGELRHVFGTLDVIAYSASLCTAMPLIV